LDDSGPYLSILACFSEDATMKTLTWAVVAVLGLLWTGFMGAAGQLSAWLAEVVAQVGWPQAMSQAGQWPVPAWLAAWLDPAWLQPLQALWAQVFDWLGSAWPAASGMAGTLLSWLVPVLWVVWGLGLAMLIALAALLHWLLARSRGLGVAAR